MKLSEELKAYIRRTGKSQAEIARLVNVSRSCICRVLQEKHDIRSTTYRALEELISHSTDAP